MALRKFLRRIAFEFRALRFRFSKSLILRKKVEISQSVRLRATDGAQIDLGDGVQIERYCDVTAKFGTIAIGTNTFVGQSSVLCARERISIGSDCLIAEMVVIRDQNHRVVPGQLTRLAGFETAPITIGNNVWIGAKATILAGVTIGDNSVVAANAVVVSDVPANVVVGGVPARILKRIGE